MAQSLASDSIHPSGKLPPTLTPTGHFAGKPTLPISRSVTLIGSRKQARLQLISSTVSQSHALIVNADSGPYIRDLASREHVYVNGHMVVESPLDEGDEIRIGRFTFKFNQSPNVRPDAAKAEPAGPGQLDVDGSPMPIPIDNKSVLIGRRDSCDIPLLEDSVSTTHAIVFEMDGRRYVRDLASRTGTFVNGKQVHQVELRPGDQIRVGETNLRYLTDSAPGVTQEEMAPADLGAETSDLVELEPETVRAARPVPVEQEPEQEVDLTPIDVEPQPAEAGDLEVELEPVAQDQAAEFEPEVELEPVQPLDQEVELEPQPLEPAPADEIEVELAAQAPVAKQPVAPPQRPVAPMAKAPATPLTPQAPVTPAAPVVKKPPPTPKVAAPAPVNPSWGANLEHFLGGMPLKLTEPVAERPKPTPQPTPQPAAPKAPVAKTPAKAQATPTPAVEPPVVQPVAKAPPVVPPAPIEPEPAPVRGEMELEPIEPEPAPVRGEVELTPLPVEPEPEAVEPLEVAEAPAAPAEPEPMEVEIAPQSELLHGGAREEEPEIEVEPAPLAAEPPMPMEMASPQDVVEEPVAEAAPGEEIPVEEPVAREQPVAEEEARVEEEEPSEVEAAREDEEPPAAEEEPVAEPPRVAAEVASREPADQMLSDEVFQIADDTDLERSTAAAAIAELDFDATQAELEEQLGITPTFEDVAAPRFDEAEIGAAPVGEEPLEEIDFSAPPEDETAAFVMPDESAFEMPPLDLGEGVNDTAVLPDSLFSVAGLDFGAPGIAEEPAISDSVAEPPARPAPTKPKGPEARKRAAPPTRKKEAAPPREEVARREAVPPPKFEPPAPVPMPIEPPPRDVAPPTVVQPPPVDESPLELTPPEAPVARAELIEPEPPAPIEVISDTEATPESALELEQAVSAAPQVDEVQPVELTDTGFGRAVEEFTQDTTGPIVEHAQAEVPVAEEEPIAATEEAPPETEAPDGLLAAEDTLTTDEAPPTESADRLFDLRSLAPPPIEEEVELEAIAPEAEAESPAPSAEADMTLELEPLAEPTAEAEVAEVEPVEVEPQEVEPEPVAEVELESAEIEPEPSAPAHVAKHDEGADTLMGYDVHVEPEPPPSLEELAPAELEPELEPVAEAPPTQQPPVQPPSRDSKPTPAQAGEDFNWGANQDQFYGGMPLKLTPPPRPQSTVVPPPRQPIGAPPREPAPTAQPPTTEPPRPRPKPMFKAIAPDTFADAPQARTGRGMGQPTSEIPPLAGKGTRPAQITTGFDGLALPSNEIDVFSQSAMNRGTADDVFGRRAIPAPPTGPTVPPGQRGPRRPARSEASGDVWTAHPVGSPDMNAQRPVPPAPPGSSGEAPAPAEPPRKKRRWFGLKSLLFLMLLLMAGAAAGIWYLLPLNSAVTGTLRFDRFDKLPHAKRLELEAQQRSLLAQESLRKDARIKLVQISPDLTPGFIDDAPKFSRTIASASLDPNSGVFKMTYTGEGSKDDQSRMLALVQALHALNSPKVAEAEALQRTVASLTQTQAETSKRIDDMEKQIGELGSVVRPDPVERATLEAQVAQHETAFNAAVADVARITAELKQAQDGTPVAIPAPPGEAQPAVPPAPDEQLTQLQAELQKVNEQIAAIQETRPAKASEARQQLQSAIDGFNKQVEQSQTIVNDTADLQTYTAAAQKLIDSSRELTDQLVRRQQEQNERLGDHRKLLAERQAARRAANLKSDPELSAMLDQQAMKTRQFNAATGQGLAPEADTLKAELEQLDAKIRERQAAVPDTGLHADEIDQLQKIVAQTQKQMDDDRTHTLAALDRMQSDFATAHPAPANLAPQAKQLAADVGKHLEQIATARRQYADSTDATRKQTDAQVAELQQKAAELTAKVEARREEIANADAQAVPPPPAPLPAQRDALIEQKTSELATAEQFRQQAEASYAAASRKLLELKNRTDQARAAGERRDALIRQRDIDAKLLLQLNNQLELKKKEAEVAVAPITPTAADIHLDAKPDQRPMYIGIACGSVMVVFVGLIMLTGTGRAAPEARGYAFDENASPRAGTGAAQAQF